MTSPRASSTSPVRGYLHIAEIQNDRLFGLFSSKDYTFTLKRTREQWKDLKKHEQDLLDALFAGGSPA